MQSVTTTLGSKTSLALAALALLAATTAGTAMFQSSAPGRDLAPVGGAEALVDLLQSNGALLWTSLAGPVTEITVQGWPVVNGDVELGGALVMERPEDPTAGTINLGEAPMTATFEVGG
jgi:hypothetical protein